MAAHCVPGWLHLVNRHAYSADLWVRRGAPVAVWLRHGSAVAGPGGVSSFLSKPIGRCLPLEVHFVWVCRMLGVRVCVQQQKKRKTCFKRAVSTAWVWWRM